MLATFMEVLDTSVANVSLPHIAGNLSATVDEATWILTSYLVSNAIVLPLGAWFSMLFGRKNFYMICVGVFTLSSALCGLAPNLESLIVFRILQGIGGGALQPISQAILVESFPPRKRGLAMAFYGMGVVFAPVIGPTLGGWITDNLSWRWIFLINLPVGALSISLTSLLIKDPPYLVRKRLRDVKIDYMGLGLLSVGLGSLEMMLDKGQRDDWFSSNFICWAAVVAAVCLVSVVYWELRTPEPVIDLHLLKERNFSMCTFGILMLGAVLYGSTVLLPIMLQTLMGYTAMQSGLVLSPGGLAVALTMPVVGMLLTRYGPRWLIVFGLLLGSFGLFRMSHFSLDIDFYTAMIARTVQGWGLAFLFVPLNTAAFAFLPRSKTQSGTGLFNLARNVGGSAGIALATTYVARMGQAHQVALISHMTPYDPAYQSLLSQAAAMLTQKSGSAWVGTQQAYGLLYGMVGRQAAMLAVADGFRLMAVAFLALIPLMLLLKTPKHPPAPAAGH
ncbi:MAG: DHA2 family efflux MFS transporter permease subunit [Candidatus Sumerlaeota bacterium]|nr:DHA2 family efflux MFS transporter permease subunit [Candidatus Sumerlaeota bacterium]